MLIRRVNYHHHEADQADPHYDIVVEGVPPGTKQFEIKQFELKIPRGAYRATTRLLLPQRAH